jgi:ABC-type uncharacterized transport system involved in gliding motility auxiliary subunit
MQTVLRFGLKFLYLPGAFLLAMGLMMGFFTEQWWPLPLLITLAGAALVTVWGVSQIHQRGWWASLDQRMVIQTAVLICCLIAVNSVIVHSSWRWDFTENQLFTLSSQTQQLVKNLKEPLKLWMFTDSKTTANQELLTAYRRVNNKFSFEFASPQSTSAQKFQVQTSGEAHLASGDRRQLLKSLYPGEAITETQLTAGMERFFADRTPLYWLQGHGEPDPASLSQATKALKNYQIQPLVLAQQAIPAKAGVLVLAGANQPLLPAEIQSIDQYLNQGGQALFLLDQAAGLEKLLSRWGLIIQERTVYSQVGPQVLNMAVVTDYGDHPIGQSFGNNISIYPKAHPLTMMPGKDLEIQAILKTDVSSWAVANNQPSGQAPTKSKALIIGTAAKTGKARLVTIGNSQFVRDGLFDKYLNSDVLLNSLGWLSNQQNLATRPKEITNRRINLTDFQTQILFWVPIALLPLLSFSGAGWLWWRQR